MQYDFPPPSIEIIIGIKKHNNPSQANNILKNPTYMISDEKGSLFLKSIGYNIFGIENGNGYLAYNRRPRKNGKKLTKRDCILSY